MGTGITYRVSSFGSGGTSSVPPSLRSRPCVHTSSAGGLISLGSSKIPVEAIF